MSEDKPDQTAPTPSQNEPLQLPPEAAPLERPDTSDSAYFQRSQSNDFATKVEELNRGSE